MGRQEYRSTFNSIKSNTAPPETSGSILGRPEHSNVDATEENDLKNNVMKMIKTLKKEMKNCPKEVKGKANKKLEKNQ